MKVRPILTISRSIETQLHSVPPWAAAFGFAMLTAVLSDWTGRRAPFAIFSICVCITGFGILIAVHDNTKLQYAALFLVAMGAYTAMPIVVCWFNMNLGGHHRRSIGSAWQVGKLYWTLASEPWAMLMHIPIGFGNIGGIIAVFAFLSADAPLYTTVSQTNGWDPPCCRDTY